MVHLSRGNLWRPVVVRTMYAEHTDRVICVVVCGMSLFLHTEEFPPPPPHSADFTTGEGTAPLEFPLHLVNLPKQIPTIST
jgi:hypothetical protein